MHVSTSRDKLHEGKRTTFGSQFSPCTTSPRDRTQVSRLGGKLPNSQTHLSAFKNIVFPLNAQCHFLPNLLIIVGKHWTA